MSRRPLASWRAGWVFPVIAVMAALVAVSNATGTAAAQEPAVALTSVDTSAYPTVEVTFVARGGAPDLETYTGVVDGDLKRAPSVAPVDGSLEVVLLVDSSAVSVDDARAMVAAASEFVLRLPTDTKIGLVTASGQAEVALAPTQDVGEVLGALAEVSPGRPSALLGAVPLALDQVSSGRDGRRALVVLAGSEADAAEVEAAAERLRTEGTSLFGVSLGGSALAGLASSAGGSVQHVDDAASASEGLRHVVDDLRSLYRLELVVEESSAPTEVGVAAGGRSDQWTTVTVDQLQPTSGDGLLATETPVGSNGTSDSREPGTPLTLAAIATALVGALGLSAWLLRRTSLSQYASTVELPDLGLSAAKGSEAQLPRTSPPPAPPAPPQTPEPGAIGRRPEAAEPFHGGAEIAAGTWQCQPRNLRITPPELDVVSPARWFYFVPQFFHWTDHQWHHVGFGTWQVAYWDGSGRGPWWWWEPQARAWQQGAALDYAADPGRYALVGWGAPADSVDWTSVRMSVQPSNGRAAAVWCDCSDFETGAVG